MACTCPPPRLDGQRFTCLVFNWFARFGRPSSLFPRRWDGPAPGERLCNAEISVGQIGLGQLPVEFQQGVDKIGPNAGLKFLEVRQSKLAVRNSLSTSLPCQMVKTSSRVSP